MNQGRKKKIVTPTTMVEAFDTGSEAALIETACRKYCAVIDSTDSGRDMKPLITGLFELVDRRKALDAADGARSSTPLAEVLSLARAV